MRKNALRNIKRYGSTGRAVLVNVTNTYDPNTLENTTTETEIPLLCFIGAVEREEVSQDIKASLSVAVMIAIDDAFDGTIKDTDYIKIDGKTYNIISYTPNYVFGELNYVRLVCVG